MKRIFSLFILLLTCLVSVAQMPQAINYQAVARDAAGALLPNQTIKVRLSIITNAPGTPVLYTETRQVTTNAMGSFSLKLGSPGALSSSGNFATINWVNNTTAIKSIRAELDINNSGVFIDMGSQVLSTVPFAFAADNAINAYNIGGNYVSSQSPNANDILKWDGSAWVPVPLANDWARNGDHLYNLNPGHVGIGTASPLARLHVADSSVVFTGPDDPSALPATPPPVSGAGTRMMWYAQKGAFRAGTVQTNEWDMSNVGINSFAAGFRSKASGETSVAIGSDCIATGLGSTAIGYGAQATGSVSAAFGNQNHANGTGSTAMGQWSNATANFATAIGYSVLASGIKSTALGSATKATGESSTAMGLGTEAKGMASTALGQGTIANGFGSLVIGMYNDTIVTAETTSSATSPLFIIGKGAANVNRSNAMVVRKDGRVGIGTNTPGGQLELSLDQARKPATSTWTITSDERLKTIEGSYEKGLKEILQLRPIVYHYKNTETRKFSEEVLRTPCIGFSAQAVQRVFPEAVGTDEDGYLNLNTHAILVAYTNAIQELNKKSEERQKLIIALQQRLESLERK